MALVLLDVDGTLLPGSSSESAFISHLAHSGRLGPRQAMAGLGFFCRWWPRYGRQVGRKNKAYLTGLEVQKVARWAAQFVKEELLHRVRPVMHQRLSDHYDKGDFVILLSGTPDFIATPLARGIGAHGWCGTRMRTHHGRFLAHPPLRHPFGREKLILAHSLCRRYGARLSECVAYGDSHYDAALLEQVGEAVAVYPDKKLEQQALAARWEIIGASTGNVLNFIERRFQPPGGHG
ncbi:MAG TPA: hypothetical protein ENJ19_12090 [Gammaproteobacteria bacterium]|nr:hypothetical protein [Gammaproteobacteria bacterium]